MTENFEQQYYKTRNSKSKSRKVISSHISEILGSVKMYLGEPLKKIDVLDVGAGQGEYCFGLEKSVKSITGIEPFKLPYEVALARKRVLNSKTRFYNLPVEKFQDNKKYDLILCLTVIEHMPNALNSFQSIFRLLKPGGVIYLTAPNKLWPYESHYKLLFLSWLPLSLASLYMRIAGKGHSYDDSAYSKTYFGMKAFFNRFPCDYEFVLPRNIEGSFMGCGSGGTLYKFIVKLGVYLIRKFPIFWVVSKGFIMIIKKT